MIATPAQEQLLLLCAIRIDDASPDWSLLAREARRPGGLERLHAGELLEQSKVATASGPILRAGLDDLTHARQRVAAELEAADRIGARLVTVLDEDYPANLRLVPNLPPFLFMLGTELEPADIRAVAVVGTRDATEKGLERAGRMARLLSENGVTVVSGLARGIDTAAHTAALDAGGRTIAVVGTGITKTYPAENKSLSARIQEQGLVASQFWPTAGGARWTFPRRNAVMSGISQGTVVIEASHTSGAKMQARLALEHGKRVFLVESLVTKQKWAQTYATERGAIVVKTVDDVIRHLAAPERVRTTTEDRQLSLDLV